MVNDEHLQVTHNTEGRNMDTHALARVFQKVDAAFLTLEELSLIHI